MSIEGKTYWLVGASAGIGAALAHQLDEAGARLVLSARSEDDLNDLAGELHGAARVIPFDVTDGEAVAEAAVAAGEIDGMVYIAGAYWPMKTTEWEADKAETMADTNFMGVMRVLGQVMPRFVARDAGHVVLIGSVAGMSGLPGAIGYAAGKAGVIHIGLCMQKDLKDTGIKVQIANPGFVKTRLTDKNDFKMPLIMEPEEAAEKIMRLMRSSRSSSTFPWAYSVFFKLRRALGL